VGTSLENGEVISFTGFLQRVPGEEPGSYAITEGSLSNTNYTISFDGAIFTINCGSAAAIQADYNVGQGGGSTVPVVTKPSGTVAGDLLVVGLMHEKGDATTVTPPNGWTLIRRTNQGNNVGMATYYKVTGENEPSNYTFLLSSSPKWSIGISRIVGADGNNPIDAHNGASGGQSYSAVAPSITTSACNTLVMTFFTSKKDATWIEPSGTTEVYDFPNIQQGLTSNMLAYFIQADKGATGTKTATASLNDYWVAQQIGIRANQHSSGTSNARTSGASVEIQTAQMSEVNLSAYPNPVQDRLFIQLQGLTRPPATTSVQVIDQVGRLHSLNTLWNSTDSTLEMDFSTVNKGLYIIRVQTDQGIQTLKVKKD
jgi:hypothetical protein